MELHQLKYFLAVVEERSFSRAAERARVAQPSLSQQIRKLEEELKQSLFDRLPKGVILTDAGQRLLPYATRILQEIAGARQALLDMDAEPSGLVTLGIIPTLCPYIARPLFEQCAKNFPAIELRIIEDITSNLLKLVESGQASGAILSNCATWPGVVTESWGEEKLVAVVPAKSHLARQRSVHPRDLKKWPVLMLAESHCLSDRVRTWAESEGLVVSEEAPALQISTLLAGVAAGRGVALVPSVVPRSLNGCCFRGFASKAPVRQINLLRNSSAHLPRAAALVINEARRVVENAISRKEKRAALHRPTDR